MRFSLKGENAHGDHGLSSWYKLGLRPPLAPQIHFSFHHHSYRENVTAPTGRPSLRSRLHFRHSRRGGGPRILREHVVALGEKKTFNPKFGLFFRYIVGTFSLHKDLIRSY